MAFNAKGILGNGIYAVGKRAKAAMDTANTIRMRRKLKMKQCKMPSPSPCVGLLALMVSRVEYPWTFSRADIMRQ